MRNEDKGYSPTIKIQLTPEQLEQLSPIIKKIASVKDKPAVLGNVFLSWPNMGTAVVSFIPNKCALEINAAVNKAKRLL